MEKFSNGRYLSFCASLKALSEVRHRDLLDSFVMSGATAKFSLTFDLAWKCMKDVVTIYHGDVNFVVGSPREVLKKAFSYGLIQDDTWLEMLSVRNNLTHDYNYELAKETVCSIRDVYLPLFEKLCDRLTEYYSEVLLS